MKPILQALLLADRVYQDADTGKKIIAGTFNSIGVARPKPAEFVPGGSGETRRLIKGGMHAGSPYDYISVTEIRGQTNLILRYLDLEDNSILLQAEFEVSCDNPLETVEITAPLPPLPVPHPGNYALELLCGTGIDLELIGSHRLRVIELEGD